MITCPMTSHSGHDPQKYRDIETLYVFSVEDGCLNILWVWPLVLSDSMPKEQNMAGSSTPRPEEDEPTVQH